MSEHFERTHRSQGSDLEDKKSQGPEINTGGLDAQSIGKQKLFQAACNDRLNQLISLDMLPQKFAEERRIAAALIENGLSDDPEAQGIEFAEIGLESIMVFKRGADEVEAKFLAKIQPVLDAANNVITVLEESNRTEDAARIRNSLDVTQEQLIALHAVIERIKSLEVHFNEALGHIATIEESLRAIQE